MVTSYQQLLWKANASPGNCSGPSVSKALEESTELNKLPSYDDFPQARASTKLHSLRKLKFSLCIRHCAG